MFDVGHFLPNTPLPHPLVRRERSGRRCGAAQSAVGSGRLAPCRATARTAEKPERLAKEQRGSVIDHITA
jgi:hypothetical protein